MATPSPMLSATARLVVDVTFAVVASRRRLVRTILGAEALHRGPHRNLRASTEKCSSNTRPRTSLWSRAVREFIVNTVGHLHGLVLEPDKPAVQQIAVVLRHPLRLGVDRVERPQQRRRSNRPLSARFSLYGWGEPTF